MSRGALITMPNGDPAAGRAAWAKKRKRKAPAKATLERRARREARKKAAENVAAEDGRGKGSAEARKKAAENVAAEDGKGKGSAAWMASCASVEAEVEVKDWSQQKRARQAQLGGSVKRVNPSPCDLEARADAVCDREAWENAMEIMRYRKSGWVPWRRSWQAVPQA